MTSPTIDASKQPPEPETQAQPKLKGFARNPELAREAGRKGGKAVPASKRTFSRNPELAKRAAKLGGSSTAPEARSFSRDPELAREAGRKGGRASGKLKAEAASTTTENVPPEPSETA